MSTLKVDGIRSNSATSDAITLASDGTCTANITNNLSNRNLIINGAMQVAQRGTSSTSSGYQTVDRITVDIGGTDESPTLAQADVASGTTPYTLGFRKAFKITNGNQTSGAGGSDHIQINYYVEAQDIATSGWDITNSSSNLTFSFWIKSSVSQFFTFSIRCKDGTEQVINFKTPVLSADTWTKVTKTIPGNSNLTVNNDNGKGFQIMLFPYIGTDYTTTGLAEDTWSAWSGTKHAMDNTSTWYTTNDATFEITGVQLEVGSVATDFEHRSFGQELALCQRYFYQYVDGSEYTSGIASLCNVIGYQNNNAFGTIEFPVTMRGKPTLVHAEGTNYFKIWRNAGSGDLNSLQLQASGKNGAQINAYNASSGTSISQDQSGFMQSNDTGVRVGFSAEL